MSSIQSAALCMPICTCVSLPLHAHLNLRLRVINYLIALCMPICMPVFSITQSATLSSARSSFIFTKIVLFVEWQLSQCMCLGLEDGKGIQTLSPPLCLTCRNAGGSVCEHLCTGGRGGSLVAVRHKGSGALEGFLEDKYVGDQQ